MYISPIFLQGNFIVYLEKLYTHALVFAGLYYTYTMSNTFSTIVLGLSYVFLKVLSQILTYVLTVGTKQEEEEDG